MHLHCNNLKTDAFEARSIELTFAAEVLQSQLKVVQDEFKKRFGARVASKYVGAGLILSGTLSPAQHREMLWALYRVTLGRFALTDDIEETPEPQPRDAGR